MRLAKGTLTWLICWFRKIEGDRMKETQNINKSLSCLGDVIGALGSGKEGTHIPYRNSKLTYLLQYSLGGNSKTLMFVMASPIGSLHMGETLTSLKFATKVHNTLLAQRRVNKSPRLVMFSVKTLDCKKIPLMFGVGVFMAFHCRILNIG
ncbi:uncharacterized protein EAF02_007777 [Botrytis sinoallii]|uniref:uncharacterized protein n=1 Tax=Botrytis sinoallii TaxID=1463999 RepID=UPI001900E97A|nr:uncharacterized protein EAF02_007777 [Botrytis sinoallii]KAF7880140.1 hypothetical protein EAF02_007777 [Botrytis sinoallii]